MTRDEIIKRARAIIGDIADDLNLGRINADGEMDDIVERLLEFANSDGLALVERGENSRWQKFNEVAQQAMKEIERLRKWTEEASELLDTGQGGYIPSCNEFLDWDRRRNALLEELKHDR